LGVARGHKSRKSTACWLTRIIHDHDTTPFFISAQRTRAVCLS
jgi:hypothetical protein